MDRRDDYSTGTASNNFQDQSAPLNNVSLVREPRQMALRQRYIEQNNLSSSINSSEQTADRPSAQLNGATASEDGFSIFPQNVQRPTFRLQSMNPSQPQLLSPHNTSTGPPITESPSEEGQQSEAQETENSTDSKPKAMHVTDWPQEPLRLTTGDGAWWFELVIDILVLLFPLCFMVMAILGEILNGKLVSEFSWGLDLIRVAKFSVSIWPIIFTALIGRALEMTGTWLMTRGATIGLLEQLFGSITMVRAITTQILLRQWNWYAPPLLLLWAFSPVGGQSILRLVHTEFRSSTSKSTVYYPDSSVGSNASSFENLSDHWATTISELFAASLTAPNSTLFGPRDVWGNFKIPRLSSLTGLPDADGWITIQNNSVSWSSLTGIAVGNIFVDGNSTFSINSSYFDLSCPEGISLVPSYDEVIWSDFNGTVAGSGQIIEGIGSTRNNNTLATSNYWWSLGALVPNLTVNQDYYIPYDYLTLYFQFQTVNVTETTANILNPDGTVQIQVTARASCKVTWVNVESQVFCMGKLCEVTAIRPVTDQVHHSEFLTPLNNLLGSVELFNTIVTATGAYVDAPSFNTDSSFMKYLRHGFNPIGIFSDEPGNLTKIDGETFAERMSRIMNTFWGPSYQLQYIANNFPSLAVIEQDQSTLSSASTRTIQNLVFVCPVQWFVLLLFASILLFTLATISTWLKYVKTITPAFLDHISSYTRNNPFANVPDGGTALGGYGRARRLRHHKIMIGDRRAEEDIGEIVIMAAVEDAELAQKARLTREKPYL